MKNFVLPFILATLAATLLAANLQYSYDAAGRLTKVDYGDGRIISYTYGPAGDLLKRESTGTAALTPAASVPALTFEANQGQIDRRYQFLARRGTYSVAVSAQEALFSLPGSTVRLQWLDANPNATPAGRQPQSATTNYLTGADAKQWRTGVPHFARIEYRDLFPGVDIVYYGNPQHLEYDLVVHPGADPSQIRFRLDGASQLSLAPNGDLVLQASRQTMLFHKPVLYQEKNGVKRPVEGAYQVVNGTVGFHIGAYDRSRPLIIDPVFGDFTLAGGTGDEIPTAAAEDAQGFLYVVGTTNSTDLPGLLRPVQATNAGATDLFVMKLSQNTKSLVWVTYLGGTGADTAGGLSVDRQGIVTVSGTTASQNFPVSADAMQRTFGGGATDGFVARLNAKGERLLYSSYIGGSAADAVQSVAVDSAGLIFAAGVTASANFPTRAFAPQDKHNGATDGFLLKINPGEPLPVYATLLGGTAADSIQGVAIDADGNAYVAGTTTSINFPTTAEVLARTNAGGADAFVAKVNATGTALVYSTYLGGSADDQALALAVNAAGSAFISGVTNSRNLPMGGNVLNRQYLGGATDGFLFQLSPNGSRLQAASYLGGFGEDSADAIAVRIEGTILVAVNGTSFPGEPARMAAYSPDLTRELGIQTISPSCMGGGSRIVALSHSATRSLAIGWARASADCIAPQRFSLPDSGGDKGESVRAASAERFSVGQADVCVGSSGTPPAVRSELPTYRPPAAQYKSSGSAGDPFSTATGEHTDQFDDLSLGGVILLEFRRYYSSVLASNDITGGLGVNWSHNFDLSLASAQGIATVTLEGGVKVAFRQVSGAWQMEPLQKSEYRLVESANDYKLGDIGAARIVTFNRRGQLTRIEDRNGNALQVTPASGGPAEVADGLGRSLKFTYAGGFLTEIRDHSGRSLRFSYRGENLDTVTDVYSRVTRFEYAASGRLARHLLPTGNPAYSNAYDAAGRVTEQADAESQTTKVTYSAGGVTAIADPLNVVTRHTHDANGDLVRVTDATGAVIEMTYDSAHRRTSLKDRLGDTTTTTYHAPTGKVQTETDAIGNKTVATFAAQVQAGLTFYNVTRLDRPDGAFVVYQYDARGNPVTLTDRTGRTWKYTYNAQGLPLTLTAPGGAVSTWTYNTTGTLATLAAFSGEVITFGRDNLGRLTRITHPDGTTRQFSYDLGDHLIQQTDENGKTIGYGLDQNQQLTSMTDELGNAASRTFNRSRLASQVFDRLGNKVAIAYDRNNLINKLTDAAGGEVEFVYDSLQRITALKDRLGTRFQFGFNKEGVPVSTTDALGRSWTFETDKLGRVTKSSTPLGLARSRGYDGAGRMVRSTNGLGETTSYAYDARGQLAAIQAPGGLKTALTRNEFGGVATLTDAAGAIWKSTFDPAGRLLTRIDPLERAFSYSYDKAGRLAEIKLPDNLGTAALTYDPAGRLVSTRYSDGVELVHKRDAKGRVVESNGLTLAYDANDRIINSNGIVTQRDVLGRVAAVSFAPDKVVRYAYNTRGQVTRITDWMGAATEFRYDASGAVAEIKRPNLVVTSLTYDGDARLASIEEKSDKLLGRFSFTYDAADRVIAEERSLPAVASQLSTTEEFAYDAAGQLAAATYDAAGRLQADTRRNYTWNAASRPTGFTSGDSAVAFAYDARGELLSRTKDRVTTGLVVNYAMARPVIAIERAGDADLRYYVHLPNGKLLYSVDAATNARRFYHFDRQGSTTLLTGDDGSVTDAYEITPYGETVAHRGNTDNPFTFLGAWGVLQQDQAGLFLMRFRLYDANTARFLSRDPKLDPAPRATNPYQYALGNPVLYSDPKGLSAAASTDSFSSLGDFFKWLFSTPEAQQMMRDAEQQEAEEVRKKAQEEERERQRVLAEKERIYREAVEAQQRWLIRFANARAMEATLFAITNFRSYYFCDLDLKCISAKEITAKQAEKAKVAVAKQTTLTNLAGQGILLANVSAKMIGLDGGTLIGLDGGTLIGLDGGTLIGLDGGTLIGLDGGT